MLNSPIRACALLIALSAPASARDDKQPTKKVTPPPGSYTAFPDLVPPTYEKKTVKKPDGTTETVTVEMGAVPLPALPPLADDAPPLRKVQYEQIKVGMAYVHRVKERMRIGAYTGDELRDLVTVTAELYLVAAELAGPPAKRVPWYEGRVRAFKEIERFIEIRVLQGSDPPQKLDLVRFQRLKAEADLLKLKAELGAGGNAPEPPAPATVVTGRRCGRLVAQLRFGRLGYAP